MTIYVKIITLAAILVALASGAQAQTPEIDALRARAEAGDAEDQHLLGLMYASGRNPGCSHRLQALWP
jgi:TPR repeat protein